MPNRTATREPSRTPTVTPPQDCLTFGQKLHLTIGILRRMGAHEGDRAYKARYDVNHDGVIDIKDLVRVIETPTCHHHDDEDDHHHQD